MRDRASFLQPRQAEQCQNASSRCARPTDDGFSPPDAAPQRLPLPVLERPQAKIASCRRATRRPPGACHRDAKFAAAPSPLLCKLHLPFFPSFRRSFAAAEQSERAPPRFPPNSNRLKFRLPARRPFFPTIAVAPFPSALVDRFRAVPTAVCAGHFQRAKETLACDERHAKRARGNMQRAT